MQSSQTPTPEAAGRDSEQLEDFRYVLRDNISDPRQSASGLSILSIAFNDDAILYSSLNLSIYMSPSSSAACGVRMT
jgi:hypothetical protein